ncbi:MAG: ATP-grasp domain-containing protein [Bacteroidales bacterium]
MHFIAVARGSRYSPNHVGNDSKILALTIEHIRAQGHTVTIYDEDQLRPDLIKTPYIFSMIRGSRSLKILQDAEKQGALIINSTRGVYNCYRENLARLLPKAGVNIPTTQVLDTSREVTEIPFAGIPFKVWVKRGDVHAIHREDVTLVYSLEELNEVIREYHRRGIGAAVVQEHITGPVVKFYAVKNTPFFHFYFHDRATAMPFDTALLIDMAQRSAEILDVDIYGGDAVIGPEGDIRIIDLNDWPSFAPVRDKASQWIAKVILEKAQKHRAEIFTSSLSL